jgi:hypothetical protein
MLVSATKWREKLMPVVALDVKTICGGVAAE